MCPGGEPALTKTDQAGSVLLASLLLLGQEFRLDFIELLYRCFYLLGKGLISHENIDDFSSAFL